LPVNTAIEIEKELVKSASGDTNTLLIILFIFFALSLIALLIRFLITKLPEEMSKDRIYLGEKITESNNQSCVKLGELISEIGKLTTASAENAKAIVQIIDRHDEQAKEILTINQRMETKLDTRPCARVYNDKPNYIKT